MRKPRDWNQPCPNRDCLQYGLKRRLNIRSIASYMTKSGRRRIFECTTCCTTFSETRATVFFDLRTPEDRVIMALKMLLVRVSLSGICFVLGVTEETILRWLKKASDKATEINAHLLKELPVTQVQIDGVWNFVARKHSKEVHEDGNKSAERVDGRQWLWISLDPVSRLILATHLGPRCFQSALAIIQLTAAAVAGVPCFFSDGFTYYLPALVEVYHRIKVFQRTGRRGRPRLPRKVPHPDLAYAQVIKTKKNGRLQKVVYKIRCGHDRLRRRGYSISTSFIERLNLTFRRPWHLLSGER